MISYLLSKFDIGRFPSLKNRRSKNVPENRARKIDRIAITQPPHWPIVLNILAKFGAVRATNSYKVLSCWGLDPLK